MISMSEDNSPLNSSFSKGFSDGCFLGEHRSNIDANVQLRVDLYNDANKEHLSKTNAPNGLHNDATNAFKKTCEKLGGAYLSGITYKEYNPAGYEDSCRSGAESIDSKVTDELSKNQSVFDSYESPAGLVESATNYSSGTKEFTDPWKATTMTDKDGLNKTQLLYSYCDVIGKTASAIKPTGISTFDMFQAFYTEGITYVHPPAIISGDVIELQNSLLKNPDGDNQVFSFRKADQKACFVTFLKDTATDPVCMNHALNVCHATFRIDDKNAETFGAHLKERLDAALSAYSKASYISEQEAIAKDAIRQIDEDRTNKTKEIIQYIMEQK